MSPTRVIGDRLVNTNGFPITVRVKENGTELNNGSEISNFYGLSYS